jgi:hypothetical protein
MTTAKLTAWRLTLAKVVLTVPLLVGIGMLMPCRWCGMSPPAISGQPQPKPECSWNVCGAAAALHMIPGAKIYDATVLMCGVIPTGHGIATAVLSPFAYRLASLMLRLPTVWRRRRHRWAEPDDD